MSYCLMCYSYLSSCVIYLVFYIALVHGFENMEGISEIHDFLSLFYYFHLVPKIKIYSIIQVTYENSIDHNNLSVFYSPECGLFW